MAENEGAENRIENSTPYIYVSDQPIAKLSLPVSKNRRVTVENGQYIYHMGIDPYRKTDTQEGSVAIINSIEQGKSVAEYIHGREIYWDKLIKELMEYYTPITLVKEKHMFNTIKTLIDEDIKVSFQRELNQLMITLEKKVNEADIQVTQQLPLSDHFFEQKVVNCIEFMITKLKQEQDNEVSMNMNKVL